MDKKTLRKEILHQRADLSLQDINDKSSLIMKKLIQTSSFQQAKTIGIYLSYNHEVDTLKLIKDYCHQKRFVVPKIEGKRHMEFYEFHSFEELKPNKFGILEPIGGKIINKNDIDLMIMPLVAYDDLGHRLGYGGGYYDTYLQDYHGHCIALAFALQKRDDLPIEAHDISLTEIINEK